MWRYLLTANNKYMKNDDKNREPSYLLYWDINNVHRTKI